MFTRNLGGRGLQNLRLSSRFCSIPTRSIKGRKAKHRKGFRLNLAKTLSLSSSKELQTGGAFGGNRGAKPVPPEKGIFPLDHLHECDLAKNEYVACLKSSGYHTEKCRHLSKKYLQCRMERHENAQVDEWLCS